MNQQLSKVNNAVPKEKDLSGSHSRLIPEADLVRIAGFTNPDQAVSDVSEAIFNGCHGQELEALAADDAILTEEIEEAEEEIGHQNKIRRDTPSHILIGDPTKEPVSLGVKFVILLIWMLALIVFGVGVFMAVSQIRASRDPLELLFNSEIYLQGLAPVLLSTCLFKCLLFLPRWDWMKHLLAWIVLGIAVPVVGLQLAIISEANSHGKQMRDAEDLARGLTADPEESFSWDDEREPGVSKQNHSELEGLQSRYGMVLASVGEGSVTSLLLYIASLIQRRYSRMRRMPNSAYRAIVKAIRLLRRKKRRLLDKRKKVRGRARALEAQRTYYHTVSKVELQHFTERRKWLDERFGI